jgi:hypothetical protein
MESEDRAFFDDMTELRWIGRVGERGLIEDNGDIRGCDGIFL